MPENSHHSFSSQKNRPVFCSLLPVLIFIVFCFWATMATIKFLQYGADSGNATLNGRQRSCALNFIINTSFKDAIDSVVVLNSIERFSSPI